MSSIDDEANEYNQLTQQEKMRRRAPAPFGLDPHGSAIKTSETALTTEEFESKAKDSFFETKRSKCFCMLIGIDRNPELKCF